MDFEPINTNRFRPADTGTRRYLLSLDEETLLIVTDLLYRVVQESASLGVHMMLSDKPMKAQEAVYAMGEQARRSLHEITGQLYPEDN